MISAEQLAESFHEAYERLASEHGYVTRPESAVPWADVPEQNKRLMIAVCDELTSLFTWTLEQFLEHGSTAELTDALADTGPFPPIDSEAEAAIRAELERRRAVDPARRDVATAKTALEIVEAMRAMVEATPWQPGDLELDDELELIAGAVHLLARRAVERRRELAANPLRNVGTAGAELAELRRRFGIAVAALLTEGTES